MKMAELLRRTRKGGDDFIARMGGDEFIIVGERTDPEAVKRLMDEIDASAIGYNQSRRSNYTLLPSMGYSFFGKDDTVDSFLAAADKEMYKNKQRRKCNREKSTAAHEFSGTHEALLNG